MWLDLFLLKSFRSMEEVGLYALAGQLAGVVQQVTITFSTLLLPHFSVLVSQTDEGRIKAFVRRLLPYWFLVTSAIFSLTAVAGGPLVPIIFGESFAGTVPPLAVLMIASTALALYSTFDPLLSAYGATWALVKITLGSVLVKILLAMLLVPMWGVMGSAVSTASSYWLSALMAMVLAGVRLQERVIRLALFGLPVVAACLGTLLFTGSDSRVVVLGVSVLSIVAVAMIFRLFTVADRAFLREVSMEVFRRNRQTDLSHVQG